MNSIPIPCSSLQAILDRGWYKIQYVTYGGHLRNALVYYSTSEYTLRYLRLGWNYTISVAAGYRFDRYRGGNCYNKYLYGEYSEPLVIETQETGTLCVAPKLCKMIKRYVITHIKYTFTTE